MILPPLKVRGNRKQNIAGGVALLCANKITQQVFDNHWEITSKCRQKNELCFHTRRYDVAHTLAKPAELDGIGFSQSNSKYFLMITVIPIKHHFWNSREAQFWQQEASIWQWLISTKWCSIDIGQWSSIRWGWDMMDIGVDLSLRSRSHWHQR